MERQTKKVKAPSGKEVELKTYLTARERRQIREAYLNSINPEIDVNGKATITSVSGEKLSAAEDKLLEVSIVSYDGSTENVLNRILDGDSPEDYDFIIKEAGALKQDFSQAK